MIPTVKVSGINAVVGHLQNVSERVRNGARQQMRRSAERVVEKARLQAPRDKWNLEESIELVTSYDSNKRLQLSVTVGGVVHGVDVDQYAALVHENYEDMGNPGPGTLEKMAQNPGVLIGSKFLTRAFEEEAARLDAYMIDVVVRAVR